jgi:hypothetical protein
MTPLTRWHGGDRLNVRLEWKPADLWIGVYWKVKHYVGRPPAASLHIWICLLPCLPIHIVKVLT